MRILLIFALLIAAFVAVTLWRAARNEAASELHAPPLGQIVEVDGHQIHALVKGTGPDLVLIHGSSGNLRDFTFSLVDQLSDRYRVIVFDRPGLGYSDPVNPKGASIFEQAAVLQKAAAQLGAEKPIVLGQSYGGSVALAWAVDHPDALSALVTLAAPGKPWDSALPRLYVLNSHPLWGRLLPPVISAWISPQRVAREVEAVFTPQAAPEGYAEHFGTGLTLRRKSLRANALQRAHLLSEIDILSPRLAEISVPMQILHGDVDTTVSLDIHARPMATEISTAELSILPGIGHMPHHVAQSDVLAAIDRAATRAALR
ncbi:alpha/beta fold hydrolase [Cognatishimia sp.]|uniref:alpha/beta fold hydrolase n=1 Tax=Cognatishimia sp. TaxID=2211648 RepID=UPI003515A895